MHIRNFVAVSLCIAALSAQSAELSASSIYSRVSSSVVSISATGSGSAQKQGSGVIIAANRVLTNCHVIEESTGLQVLFFDSQKAVARPLGRYSTLDLCVVEAPTLNRPIVDIRGLTEIKPGLKVIAVGNPLGLTASVTEGLVSGVREHKGFKVLQHSAPTSPGSSGGGLFDSQAKLVALTTSSNQSGQNINFAIPAEYVNVLTLTEFKTPDKTTLWATFKELPFGSNQDALMQAFPDAACKPQNAQTVTCAGTTDYFSRRARYSIWLSNRGVYMAYARIFTSEMDQAFSEAGSALLDRFGVFDTVTPDSLATWRVGDNKEQGIVLTKCDGKNNCLDKAAPGVMVIIMDDRFKPEKRKEF